MFVTVPHYTAPRDFQVVAGITFKVLGADSMDVDVSTEFKDSSSFIAKIRRVDSIDGWKMPFRVQFSVDKKLVYEAEVPASPDISDIILSIDVGEPLLRAYEPIEQLIPKLIIQTDENKNQIPLTHYRTMQSLLDKNPDYALLFFDDEACIEFVRANFSIKMSTAYEMIRPGAFKADLFRLLALYHYGGIYVDLKKVALVSMSAFVPPTCNKPIFCLDREPNLIYNSVIACPKHSSIMFFVADQIATNILERRVGTYCLDITGPRAVARALNKAMNRDDSCHFQIGDYPEFLLPMCWQYGHVFVKDHAGQELFLNYTRRYYEDVRPLKSRLPYGIMYARNELFEPSRDLAYPTQRFSTIPNSFPTIPHSFPDMFWYTVEGQWLCVKRTDCQSSWDINLHVYDHEECKIICVGPSKSPVTKVPL